MNIMLSIVRVCLAILGAGFVMAGWSENYFFNEGPAEALLAALEMALANAVLSQIEIALFYAIPALVALAAMAWRGSFGMARAMLIAAIVGFAIEGALVPAVYEAVPVSYLWTSVAWHGPITVGLGLFLMPRLLARLSPVAMASVAAAAGGFWGIWTTWVWEGGIPNLSTEEFAIYAAWTFAGIALGYVLLHLAGWPRVTLARPVVALFALVGVSFFVIQGLLFPVGALGLAVILAALVWALARWDHTLMQPERLRWANLALLALMPTVAVGTYAVQVHSGPLLSQDDLIALTFAGGLLTWIGCLGAGYRRALRKTDAVNVAS